MQFYEPGKYEDFIGKLASISIRPSVKVWESISDYLYRKERARKRALFHRFAYAAGFVLIITISWMLIHFSGNRLYNEVSLYSSYEDFSSFQPLFGGEMFQDYHFDNIGVPNVPPTGISANSNESYDFSSQDIVARINPIPPMAFNKKWSASHNIRPLAIMPDENQVKSVEPAVINSGNAIESTSAKKLKDWEIVAFVNPTFAYHTTAALNQKMNPTELGTWMWGGDILVKRRIGRYFSISTGLQLSPLGQVNKNLVFLRSEGVNKDMMVLSANTSFGMVSLENRYVAVSNFSYLPCAPSSVIKSSSITPARLNQNFYFLEIPIFFSSHYQDRSFEVEVKLGCSAGVLVANWFEVISNEGVFYGKTENVRPFITNAIASVGIAFPLRNNLTFSLEPSLKLSVTPISYDYESTYPFSGILKVGIGYRF